LVDLTAHLLPLATSSELLPAREQMAWTLGRHIILSCFGVAFPAFMLITNYKGLGENDPVALELAQRRSKAVAVLFALGVIALLLRDRPRGTRVLAVGAVVTTVCAWGVAQVPYPLPQRLTVAEAAAVSETLNEV
jgi:hypothetical protein